MINLFFMQYLSVDRRWCSYIFTLLRSLRPVLIILQHDSCPLCRQTLVDNQDREDNENSLPAVGDNIFPTNIQEARAQLTNNGGINPINLAFGFHDPDLPPERDGNADRVVEYSGMYS
jgi:hypothetical protein